MDSMFLGCKLLKYIDLSNFNTKKVTNMNSMFSECHSLGKIDLSNFNTKNVTNMYDMLLGCSYLSKEYVKTTDLKILDSFHIQTHNNFTRISLEKFGDINRTDI